MCGQCIWTVRGKERTDMWQIVRYEIEKLMRKKIVWACLLGMVLMECALITNWIYPGTEGVQYFQDGELMWLSGRDGIREAQAIAEKYAGPLTDDKVQAILKDFDMPDEDMEKHGMDPDREGYYTHNPLYSSLRDFQNVDGSWNGLTVREVYGDLAEDLNLGYSSGWVNAIYALVYTLLSLFCVLTILLAPLFAEEYTRGTDALILTGAYGKTKCAWAKILTGFLVSLALIAIVVLTFLAVYLVNYGTLGWNASIQLNDMGYLSGVPYFMTCGQGVLYAVLMWFTAGLVLTAVAIVISALAKSSFTSLVISFALFVLPMFINWDAMGFLNLPAQFLPVVQIQLINLFEHPILQIGALRMNMMWLTVPVAVMVVAACSVFARRAFARHQVMG